MSPDKPAGSRRHTPHAEFLKCLHMFGAGILNREELVSFLKTLFEQGHAPKAGNNAAGSKSNTRISKAAAELLAEFESVSRLLLGFLSNLDLSNSLKTLFLFLALTDFNRTWPFCQSTKCCKGQVQIWLSFHENV